MSWLVRRDACDITRQCKTTLSFNDIRCSIKSIEIKQESPINIFNHPPCMILFCNLGVSLASTRQRLHFLLPGWYIYFVKRLWLRLTKTLLSTLPPFHKTCPIDKFPPVTSMSFQGVWFSFSQFSTQWSWRRTCSCKAAFFGLVQGTHTPILSTLLDCQHLIKQWDAWQHLRILKT